MGGDWWLTLGGGGGTVGDLRRSATIGGENRGFLGSSTSEKHSSYKEIMPYQIKCSL